MKRALIIYAVVVILVAWASGYAAWALQEQMGQWAFVMLVPMAIVPLVMAYVGHRISGAVGNPFRGLRWGPFSWYALVWFAGLVVAGLAVALCFGLNLATFDLGMNDYLALVKDAMAEQGQNPDQMPASALKIQGWITFGAALAIGPFFGAAVGCLSTFPHFGWFGRRVLVYGRFNLVLTLIAVYILSSATGGLLDNPQMGDYGLLVRMSLILLSALSGLPIVLWLFFRSHSAVLPALAIASYQSGWAATVPFISDAYPWLVSAQGVVASGVILAVGLGLWFVQDPGGDELAVAAVAFDGTPLTPQQAAAYDTGEHHDLEQLTTEVVPETAPPPDPGIDDPDPAE